MPHPVDPAALLTAVELLADAIADRVAAKLRNTSAASWVDQHASALGSRRHCALVRSLMKNGDPRASRVGRRYLLTGDALTEALAHAPKVQSREVHVESETVAQRLDRKLRLVGGVE